MILKKLETAIVFYQDLWWLNDNLKNAEDFAQQAIELLKINCHLMAKAMATVNMSQLKMLSDQTEECIFWGEKAIAHGQGIS